MQRQPSKPYKEFTETLREALQSKKGEDLEIEIRFGILQDPFTRERLSIACLHPIVINTKPSQLRFIPGISESDFNSLMSKFMDYEHSTMNDRIVIHKLGRYSFVNGEINEAIKKTGLLTYNIHNPGSPYDMRLSISRETKIEFVPITDRGAIKERLRERTSFKIRDISLDCTVVKGDKGITYEVEAEVVNPNYNIDEFIQTAFKIFK